MNHKVSAGVSALLLTLTAGSVNATSGILTFTGDIADNTCQIEGLDGAITLPHLTQAKWDSVAGGGRVQSINVPVKVTNCPSSVTTATLKVDYTTSSLNSYAVDLGTSTVEGIMVNYRVPVTESSGPGWTRAGAEISRTLDAGEAVFSNIVGIQKAGTTFSPGVFSVPVNLSMTYN